MHIVILGNGISGITAARHIRKGSDHRITVISKESEYFFSRTALMYVYMGHMKFEHTKPYEDWFWKKNRIDLMQDEIMSVAIENKSLILKTGATITYDKLIIASGSRPKKSGWPGQDLKGVQGLYSKQDLESMEVYTKNIKRAVIVGGGLIGIEMAEMLASRNIPVTYLVREKHFWGSVLPQEEATMINKHILDHHIDLRNKTKLAEILSDEDGRVRGVVTDTNEMIECQFVGLTIGVTPSIDFLKGSGIACRHGVVVNKFLETNIQDVYAIGDCAEFTERLPNRKHIEQVWYTGKIMGEAVAATICNQPMEYTPGNWFNSAKFFDIEYQTYGWVFPGLQAEEQTFYWENPGKQISLRINFHKVSHAINGVMVLGMRLRHLTFDQWIREKKTVEYILEHLPEANFDPEFYKQHERSIIDKFNAEHATTQLQVKAKRGLFLKISNPFQSAGSR
ncbi:MAG: NAD(P)/FAD-dependent oxidoreductase [Chitinophagaceae bacterium]|nr:NAD(P)/FAD-dependent oxidoreductase [Chitinophagaceae bacterium]